MRPVARIAQSVEQGIENPRVRGSIPRPGTNILKTQPYGWVFAFCRSGRFLVTLTTDVTALIQPSRLNISFG